VQIVIDGILTNYEILGSNNQKSILILHGWGQSLENWRVIAEKLSTTHKVILLDLPGFGSSSQANTVFNIKSYSNFVNNFINKIGLKNMILIGHSFGGKISIKLASSCSKVSKLFLISPSGIENKSFVVIIKTLIFKILKLFLFWLPNNIKDKYVLIFGSRDYKNAGAMRQTFKNVIADKMIIDAQRINIPTIVIWGETDTELNLKNAKILKNLIENSTLRVLWGVGHSPNIETPDKLVNLLFEYL
jgi:pimeloyl-ACP methyl ester carboxylesterase